MKIITHENQNNLSVEQQFKIQSVLSDINKKKNVSITYRTVRIYLSLCFFSLDAKYLILYGATCMPINQRNMSNCFDAIMRYQIKLHTIQSSIIKLRKK